MYYTKNKMIYGRVNAILALSSKVTGVKVQYIGSNSNMLNNAVRLSDVLFTEISSQF